MSIFYYDDTNVMNVYLDSYSIEESSDTEAASTQPATEPVPTIGFEEGTYHDVYIGEFVFSIPNYWEGDGSKEEYLQYYAETGGKVSMLCISYPVDDVDEVTYELLINDNENMIEAIESMYKNCEVIGHESFTSDYGIEGIVYNFTFTYREFFTKYEMSGKWFCFPSPVDNRWFNVIIGVSDNTDTDAADYFADYATMLASIRDSE